MRKIVTISRQYGSGGRIIGKILAEKLNVPFYDKKILDMAAEQSGYSRELMEGTELKAKSSFAYNLASALSFNEGISGSPLSVNEKLFLAQFQVIKEIGDTDKAVIVGRCADYVLSEKDNVVKVYITSDFDTRVNTVMKRHDLTQSQARDLIIKTDKRRSNYYSYYTGEKWGKADKYDLVVSTAKVGIDGAAGLIADYIKMLG